jgi:hypothetical protein
MRSSFRCVQYRIGDVHFTPGPRDSAYGARGVQSACKGIWAGAAISERALCVVVADRAEAVDVDDADEGLGPGRRCGGTDLCNQGGAL